jgi:hypothetical protein
MAPGPPPGPVPGGGGKRWTVVASRRSASHCRGVRLEMKFRPVGTRLGSWRTNDYEPAHFSGPRINSPVRVFDGGAGEFSTVP